MFAVIKMALSGKSVYGPVLKTTQLSAHAQNHDSPERYHKSLPAALREAQTCRYLVYSEANFEVFRPAGATRCTDGGEIWHGGGEGTEGPLIHLAWRRGPKVPSSMPNFTPIGATTRV